MKQNFLLKSFVLLIALLAGGISAWADPTYHNFMSSGVTILSDSYVGTWSNSSTSGYWMTRTGSGTVDVTMTDALKEELGVTDSKITGVKVKASGTRDLTLYFTNVTAIKIYSYSSNKSRKLQYKLNDGDVTDLHDYTNNNGYGADEITGLTATTNYALQLTATNDLGVYAIAVTVPASGKDPSTFALISDEAVTLWKGETSTIKYENNIGTVAFSNGGDSYNSIATVSEEGVITAVGEGTATITVTDPGSERVDGAIKYVAVTVKEHKNTTTTHTDGEEGKSMLLYVSSFNETISSNALGENTPLTFGVGPLITISDGNNNNFQAGSNNNNMKKGETTYIPIKCNTGRTITITAGEGVTFAEGTKIYLAINDNSATGTVDGTSIEVPSRGASMVVDGETPDVAVYTPDLSTNNKVISFSVSSSKSQIIACFDMVYNVEKHMSVTIKETGYATLFTDYAVAIPEGVEAFTGKYNSETQTVQLSAVTGTVPANTAVILHTETPGTYSFVAAENVAAITNNDLRGTLVEMPVDAQSVYTLGLGGADNTVGMRLYNGTTIRAYSAYMEIPTATIAPTAPFLSIGFGEEGTTGIRSIDNGQLTIDNVYYDLAGRRVAQPSKGVYIVNGKKVVIK